MKLYRVHKWVGLGVGVLLFVQAFTGLLMAHKTALASLWHVSIDVSAPHQPLERIVEAVAGEFPHHSLERIVYPDDPSLPLIARALAPDDDDLWIALVDPTDARILDSGPVWQFPLQLAERLHVSLFMGGLGHNVLLVEALALVFMAVSGLIVWWPRNNKIRKALTIRWTGHPMRRLRDLHAVPGALTAVLMLLAGTTGALIVAEPLVRPAIALVAPVSPEFSLALPDVAPPTPKISWQQAFDRLHQRFPDGRLRQVRFMGQNERILGAVMVAESAVNPRAHHIAMVDRWADEITVFADGNDLLAGNAVMEWFLPLHTGEAYGPLRGVLMTLLGGSLMGMTVTGIWMWAGKRRPKRRALKAASEAGA